MCIEACVHRCKCAYYAYVFQLCALCSPPECVKQWLVEEDCLHAVHVEVTHVHLQHLQTLEQVQERPLLVRQDLGLEALLLDP